MDKKTILLIVGAALVLILVAVLLFFRFSVPTQIKSSLVSSGQASSIEDLNIRMDQSEAAIAKLIAQVGVSSTTPESSPSDSANLEARVNNLESAVASLQSSINSGKSNTTGVSTNTVTATTSQPPSYIPLGWQGSANTMTWSQVTTQTFTLNPASYPGMTSVEFDVSLQVYQGNGTAYASLFNSTDGVMVSGSNVSTTSENYTWVNSGTFPVPSTQKTYVLNLMTNTGYPAMVQNARLKINF